MVSLSDVQSSNALIPSTLPGGLVAVFVGATSGIGEYSLKAFAQYAVQPRIYFVGRSQEAADRIVKECMALNPDGSYTFIKADTSLMRNVDDVCGEIRAKEKVVNLLFLTTGSLQFGMSESNVLDKPRFDTIVASPICSGQHCELTDILYIETEEGLHVPLSLTVYARTRFALNLLPLLQNAKSLRRVISVFAAGKEGQVFADDFQGWKVPLLSGRGHLASLVTLSLEALAKKAPDVTFIHNFPGAIKSNLTRSGQGTTIAMLDLVSRVVLPFVCMSNTECGERHLFLATSAAYPAAEGSCDAVSLGMSVSAMKGTNGRTRSGVYSVCADGESLGRKVEELLGKFRREGTVERLWEHIEGEFRRILGTDAVEA